MKKLVVLLVLMIVFSCYGKSTTSVSRIDGAILHSVQSAWIIVETENSAESQTNALVATEMTKKLVDALIAADANEEGYISTFNIPSKWNGMRFRAIGITPDGGTLMHHIYLGSLGGRLDCELTYAGQLVWTIGTQTSIYAQIGFTSGGTYEPKAGDIVTGNASGHTAIVVSLTFTDGSWADANAVGVITYMSPTGGFTSGETVNITHAGDVLSANVLTHASSVLVAFELADTLAATTKSWGIRSGTSSSWATISPANNTNAEAEIDVKGADYMVIVTSSCATDGKLIVKGY